MAGPHDSAPTRVARPGWLLAWLVAVVAAGVLWAWPRWKVHLESLGSWEVRAGPIVAPAADGRPMVATLVTRERIAWQRPTRRGYASDQIVALQLNHADGRDAGRVVVHRSEASVLNLAILGATADRVWVFAEGPHVVRLSERRLELDPAGLAARIPALAGQLSDDARHYEVTDAGVALTTRDGRRLAFDPADWTPVPAATATPLARALDMDAWRRAMADYERRMAEATGPRTASLPGELGLTSWRSDDRWIGVLSDEERAQLDTTWARPRQASFGTPARRRLWLADASRPYPEASELDARVLADLRPAPDGRVYLRGGILRDGHRLRAVPVPGSSDVLVEHYTAIDASAELRLTRVTPEGDERWTAALPLRHPRTADAAGEHVVLTGLPPGVADARRLQLVSVRLADGAVATFAYDR